jgi:hypothetical protein
MLQLRGAWEEAEAEARQACVDMTDVDVFAVAGAHYEVGEIRRIRGDVTGAEEAYRRAHEIGRDPQPGLALLRLAQGRVDAAGRSISAAIASFGGSRLELAPLHAAQVEIALAASDVDTAAASAAEVAETAETFHSAGLRAAGHRAQGAVALARGEAVTALAVLRLACAEADAQFGRCGSRPRIRTLRLHSSPTRAAAQKLSDIPEAHHAEVRRRTGARGSGIAEP